LLPLDCEAALVSATEIVQLERIGCFATAAQPSGTVRRSDKLPRHKLCGVH